MRQHHGLAGDRVIVWAALAAGKDALVHLGRVLRLAENHRPPRSAHRLVRREADEVGMRNGARVRASRHQAGEMRHVDEEVGIDRFRD